ncbi:MAG: hypothetical protein JKX76_02295 [Colwellia sp.]|nr:hypothetical protein [Colwellia sp.]
MIFNSSDFNKTPKSKTNHNDKTKIWGPKAMNFLVTAKQRGTGKMRHKNMCLEDIPVLDDNEILTVKNVIKLFLLMYKNKIG